MTGICCKEITRHPAYSRFNRLMRGPGYTNRELREIYKSEDFKRFAALFLSSVHSGEQGPDSSDKGQPGNENSRSIGSRTDP